MDSAVVRKDVIAAAVLVAFGAAVVAVGLKIPLGVATDPLGPRTFPVALGAGIAICGVLLVAGMLLFRSAPAGPGLLGDMDPEDEAAADAGPFSLTRLVGAVAITAGYLAAFEPVGYLLSTWGYVLALMMLHGGAPGRSLVSTPPLVTLVLYLTFKYGLRIPVPEGMLAPLLSR